jgi:hypothetical protein
LAWRGRSGSFADVRQIAAGLLDKKAADTEAAVRTGGGGRCGRPFHRRPAYNRKLRGAIATIAATSEDGPAMEIVVVDDCSADGMRGRQRVARKFPGCGASAMP